MTARRVLVVDDSPFTGEAVAWALRRAGYTVQIARDLSDLEGPLAPPDLVLMDVVLEDAFGDELVPVLRTTREIHCPVFLISSLPAGELAQRVAEANLAGFICKQDGLAAIVARVRRELGGGITGPVASVELAGQFDVNAHQRLRRIRYIATRPERWSAAAIEAEMHALAGDAELVGKSGLAHAARACRDVVRAAAASWTASVHEAIHELARLVGDECYDIVARLLVLDGTEFSATHLIAELDERGFLVVEARTLGDARPSMRSGDFDLILVEHTMVSTEPTLLAELRGVMPYAPIAIIADRDIEHPLADALLHTQHDRSQSIATIERLLLL